LGSGEQLSVALIIMDEYVPAVAGTPEITPAGLIFNPGGKGELLASRLKVTGGLPPVACSAALYAVPTIPELSACGKVIVSAGHCTTG
jgi:hypothetical protein